MKSEKLGKKPGKPILVALKQSSYRIWQLELEPIFACQSEEIKFME